jgi:hypothetical protein
VGGATHKSIHMVYLQTQKLPIVTSEDEMVCISFVCVSILPIVGQGSKRDCGLDGWWKVANGSNAKGVRVDYSTTSSKYIS